MLTKFTSAGSTTLDTSHSHSTRLGSRKISRQTPPIVPMPPRKKATGKPTSKPNETNDYELEV